MITSGVECVRGLVSLRSYTTGPVMVVGPVGSAVGVAYLLSQRGKVGLG